MIEVSNISAGFGGTPVLRDISFSAKPGEHIALIGPNGAGKSTLLRILAGLIEVSAGNVEFRGKTLSSLTGKDRARQLSYLPQSRELAWDLSAGDVAALGLFAWGARRYKDLAVEARTLVDDALVRTGASNFRERSVHTLSGGERARVHLARTLVSGSDVLLLDEPCASLDIRHQLELMEILQSERKSGKTVITVLHDIELAERYATRTLVLHEGVLIADINQPGSLPDDVLNDVFGLKRRKIGGFITDRQS